MHPMAADTTRQISLRLPADLLRLIDAEARERQLERSQLVRELLEAALSGQGAAERPADRVSELIGRYQLGIPDLGARHREHLRDVLRDRR